MEIYFELLPTEINELIIINLTPEEIYGVKTLFPYIDDNKFWYRKVQYDFPWTNMEFIPPHYYTYSRKPLQYITFQYELIKNSYMAVSKVIEEREDAIENYKADKKENPDNSDVESRNISSWSYKFEYINNIDVLVLWKRVSVDKIDDMMGLRDIGNMEIELILNGNGDCEVYITQYRSKIRIRYNVSVKEIFNIAQHIYLNGGDII